MLIFLQNVNSLQSAPVGPSTSKKLSEHEETGKLEGCKICLDEIGNMLLLPCKHLCMCNSCARILLSSVEGGNCAQCPLCRTDIRNVQKIYNNRSDSGKDENRSLESCLLCLQKIGDSVLLPCRHLCVCDSCAQMLSSKKSPCPLCHGPVESMIKIFIT